MKRWRRKRRGRVKKMTFYDRKARALRNEKRGRTPAFLEAKRWAETHVKK